MFNSRTRKLGVAAVSGILALTLAACGGDEGATGNGGDGGNGDSNGGETSTITLGWLPSWTDGRSMGTLVQVVAEDMGYEVELEHLSEAGPLYTALAQGDIDMYPSAWSEVTHASYMEKYGDQTEDIGTYYSGAVLTWAVPEYSEIQSIEDIPDFADELGNRIVGIEPGAGHMEVSQDSVIPAYGLEDFELQTSSTAAMLTELQSAIDNEEEIVVTLWRPFWANEPYNVRDLEDPQGALGEPEGLHFLGRTGFSDDFPELFDDDFPDDFDDDFDDDFPGLFDDDFPEDFLPFFDRLLSTDFRSASMRSMTSPEGSSPSSPSPKASSTSRDSP